MKGMRGEADLDNDSKIKVSELSTYLEKNVSEMAGMLDREQNPTLLTPDENRVLIAF